MHKLETIKKAAPEIPSETCPYINFLQDILDQVKADSDSHFIEQKLNLADSILEYIRESNESLRDSSSYWYNKFNSLCNKKK